MAILAIWISMYICIYVYGEYVIYNVCVESSLNSGFVNAIDAVACIKTQSDQT